MAVPHEGREPASAGTSNPLHHIRTGWRFLVLVGVALTLLVPSLEAGRMKTEKVVPTVATRGGMDKRGDLPLSHFGFQRSVATDTFVLARYDFEGPGGASTEGWVGVDRTSQPDTFFHVDDFVATGPGSYGGLTPLAGSKSLWCGGGGNPTDPVVCSYATAPGYGRNWRQRFESVAFPAEGDVTFSYKVRWDSEPGYDYTYVEYTDAGGAWNTITCYHGTGELVESFVIDSDSLGTDVRLRFRFKSDSAWDDEDGEHDTDGAVIIDSVTVADTTGVIDYQDFELEPVGALTTSDGDWRADVPESFGRSEALYPGLSVLQEDLCDFDMTSIWGFFADPAVENYGCGGHPEQGAIRKGGVPSTNYYYIWNEIWSPSIPFAGSGDQVLLTFQVYRDLPRDNLIFYEWHVRSWVSGCPGPWKDRTHVYYGPYKDWFTYREGVGDLIDAAADSVQIALAAVDMCQVWCGLYGTGICHSQGPLFDDVSLVRIDATGPIWSVQDVCLFQDSFSTDGTATGAVRADMARDIAWHDEYDDPGVDPGDSVVVTVAQPSVGLGTDPYTGCRPAVYAHVAVWPPNQPGKTGPDLLGRDDDPEATPPPSCGSARWPLVDSTTTPDGATWYQFLMDSVFTFGGRNPSRYLENRFCFDLNDNLFTPGDTIYFYFSATDGSANTTYWSQFTGATASQPEVTAAPMEMTCLPANALTGATDILYVDHYDQEGAQPYFEDAFEALGITPDRYDVRSLTSLAGNGPGGRVINATTQLVPYYRTIIWNSGNLEEGTLGDGTGDPRWEDDFTMLNQFLSLHSDAAGAGLYLSGDNLAEEWDGLVGSAPGLRAAYMEFSLLNGDHVGYGLPISPQVVGQAGSMFDHSGAKDEWIAYGGCPSINNFDVLQAAGSATVEAAYMDNPAYGAVLAQDTLNPYGNPTRVVLSGFSFHEARDGNTSLPAHVEHMQDILAWIQGGGAATPTCQVIPNTIDFDSVGVGAYFDAKFMITNIGADPLIGSVEAPCSHYSIVSGGTYSLTTGQIDTVKVRFQPTTIGAHNCTIDTGELLCSDVFCEGVGVVSPLCVITPSTIDFGEVNVSSLKDTTFTIKNMGDGTLDGTITESCSDYSVTLGDGPFSLAPEESLLVSVRFEPTAVGTLDCMLDVGTPDNRMVYVSTLGGGLEVFDAKDPAHPASRGALATADLTYGVFVSGSRAYLADGLSGLRILSIVDPLRPLSLGNCPTPHRAQDVHVSGGYAYVTAFNAGLRVMDVTDPTSPAEVGSYVIPGTGYAYGLEVSGTYAYIAASDSGLVVVDVSNPMSPTQIGGYDTPVWAWDVDVVGDYAYVAGGWGLVIVDVSDPFHPDYEGGYGIGPWSYGVCVSGDYAYLGNSTEGLTVIDVSDPSSPTLHGSCDTPGLAFGVVVEGQIAYVADSDSGLQVIDISDPSSPTILRTLDTPGTATRLAVRNGGDVVLAGVGRDPSTGVGAASVPTVYALHHNVPNPFNPTTTIRYDVPEPGGKVTLRVYDVAGRLVRTLVDGSERPGDKRVVWNGRSDRGTRVATGVYFCRMTAAGFTDTRKMVLLK